MGGLGRPRLFFAVILATACLVASCLSGCASSGSPPASVPRAQSTDASTSTSFDWLRSEIASATELGDVDLIPDTGASRWLGGEQMAAFRDRKTSDEFIVDLASKRLVGYSSGEPDSDVMGESARYPGEPSRAKVLRRLDRWLSGRVKGIDTSTMRRTVSRQSHGDTLGYEVSYQRYVRGVRVREYVDGHVGMYLSNWKPLYSVYAHRSRESTRTDPVILMPEAIQIARASGVSGHLQSANLTLWGRGLEWVVGFGGGQPLEGVGGGHGTVININALTGRITSKASS
jgi:hypothetical protein